MKSQWKFVWPLTYTGDSSSAFLFCAYNYGMELIEYFGISNSTISYCVYILLSWMNLFILLDDEIQFAVSHHHQPVVLFEKKKRKY